MEEFNKSLFSNKVQEILATGKGVITHSSNSLFKLLIGDNIYQLHPFFESLEDEITNSNNINLAFPCVQLDIDNDEIICDITIKKERGDLAILLFDYSEHYENLHDAAQEKKTAMLNEQAHNLNTHYNKEKKAYKEFVRDRIDNKIVKEMENIVLDLKKLKDTKLTESQMSLINSIEKNIGNLHLKAVQIKEGLSIDLD